MVFLRRGWAGIRGVAGKRDKLGALYRLDVNVMVGDVVLDLNVVGDVGDVGEGDVQLCDLEFELLNL